MGNKTQTSTSQQTSTPVNTAALQGISNQVASAAATPYTPYTGELTAGINGQQTTGINTINAGANSAQPYYAQAGQLASSAANPLTAAQIQQYQNPYTQNVVNATQAQFNDQNGQQQNSLKGTAAQQGALGGDRQAVAQSQLAGQQQLSQAPVIAGLYSNSYNSGLQTAANQFQQNPLAAASALGNVGAGTENAALAGGNAQLQAGTQQQQTQQAADTANYGQYQAAQAFPYQNAAFAEQYGLPAALSQGTTSSGTQTAPGPSILGQLAGLGIAGAGVATKFAADGGRIDYATGGSPGYVNSKLGYIDSNQGYIPTGSGAAGPTSLNAPALKFAGQPQQSTTTNPMTSAISGLPKLSGPAYGGGNIFTDAYGGSSSNPLPGLDASDYGPGFKIGGLVHAIHEIHKTIKRSRGGSVNSAAPFQAFDDGGDVSFADRFSPATDNPFGDMSRGQAIALLDKSRYGTTAPRSIGGNDPAPPIAPTDQSVVNPDSPYRMDPTADQAWRNGNPALTADANMPDASGNPPANPMSLPSQITNPDNTPEQPSSAMAFDSTGQAPTSLAPQSTPDQPTSSLNPFHLSDKGSNALIAAGFGMLASRSPFAGVALGEGGLQGLKSYSEETKAEQDAKEKATTRAQEQQRIDLQAKTIAQNAAQFAKTNALAVKTQAEKGDLTEYQKSEIEHKKKTDDPEYQKQLADAKRGTGMSDLAVDIKARQMANGDLSGLTNIGRGAQAGQTLERIANRAAEIRVQENGETPEEAAQNMSKSLQEFKAAGIGKSAEARTAATREANLNLILKATDAAIPAALEASQKVARTGWVPVNKIIQNGEIVASNPELKEFGMANLQLAEHWARAMNPTGVMRESDRDKALSFLSTADSQDTYQRAVMQLQKQITRERDAVRGVTGGSTQFPAPGGAGSNAPSTAPGAPVTKTIGNKTYVNRNGQWFEQ